MFGSSKRTVLYYPTIDIPKRKWLRQALMYWDNLASIVPMVKEGFYFPYNPEFLYLLENKILTPINPIRLYDEDKYVVELENETREIIETPQYQHFIGPSNNWIINSRIHANKVSNSVVNYLQSKKLANPKIMEDEWGSWYLFERKTALLYMSLLARYLSEIEKEYTVPSTDEKLYENLIFSPLLNDAGTVCTKALFSNILPVPREDVPIEQIIDFREDHRKDLLRFRKRVSKFQDDISKAEDEHKIKEITTNFAEDKELGIIEITDGLMENNIQFGLDSLTTCIKSPTFISGLFSVGTKIVAKSQGIDIPLETTITPPIVVGSIEIGCHYVKSRLRKSSLLNKSAFSYLYHARKIT